MRKRSEKRKNVTFARKGRSGASMRESYQISNLMPCTRRARYETLERWREAMEKVQFESLENCVCSAKILLLVLAKQSLERCWRDSARKVWILVFRWRLERSWWDFARPIRTSVFRAAHVPAGSFAGIWIQNKRTKARTSLQSLARLILISVFRATHALARCSAVQKL